MALLLIVSSTLCFAGCNGETESTEPESKGPPEAVIPDGYVKFENDFVSFAYPDGWNKKDGSTTTLTNPDGKGNNITVVYEAKTDQYKNVTLDSFNENLAAPLEAMGMKVTNPTFKHEKNSGEIEITIMKYTLTYMGIVMEQTIYAFDSEDKTHLVTVTEAVEDENLVKNVFDTIRLVKKA
jgi:hypothetical protein